MAKQSGLQQNLYVDGMNISGDTQAISKLSGGCAVLEFTGIDKRAFERKGGLRDGGIDATTFFNPGSTDWAVPLIDSGSHEYLRQMPLTDKIVSFFHLQSTDAASLVAKQGTYDGTRAADGALTFNISTVVNGYGLEWGDALTAGVVTHTAADEEASLDGGAATAFGAQAYLHVFDLDGDDVTVAIQSSSDNGAGDAFADIAALTFTEVTASPVAERVQTARDASIERYLRVATTGTFDSVSFAVMVVRNPALVNF
jgi:hypothetical protein